MPYYGKNQIRYDNFKRYIYTTDHFEIYYYPETEQHLERVASYAESAYQQISADLKHDLAFKVSMIIFKTSSEFQEQNVIPGAATEGVGAFAEPTRNRMLLPLDEPPDLCYRLIVHELTHIFEFDIIPQSLIRRSVPLWVNEGLSDYMTGSWTPIDLMTVRDAAVSDIVPKMTDLEGYGGFNNPRLIYNLGHAVFEFIDIAMGQGRLASIPVLAAQERDRWRRGRVRGSPQAASGGIRPGVREVSEEPLQAVPRQGATGRLWAEPGAEPAEDEVRQCLLGRAGTVGRNHCRDDRQSQGPGARYRPALGERRVRHPQPDQRLRSDQGLRIHRRARQPLGHRAMDVVVTRERQLAYFARMEKRKALIIENIIGGKIEQRITMDVDEPESPAFSPDGKTVAFSALRGGVSDLFTVDLATHKVTNLTNDAYADYAPVYSPDGKFIIFLARVSGNNKLFQLDLATNQRTQLTFGTHDEPLPGSSTRTRWSLRQPR